MTSMLLPRSARRQCSDFALHDVAVEVLTCYDIALHNIDIANEEEDIVRTTMQSFQMIQVISHHWTNVRL